MLTRDTGWRQGDLLTQETAAKLTALSGVVGKKHRVVVTTHDGDLPHDGEISVEVIAAEIVTGVNPQFSYAKNPRTLHLGKLHLGYAIAGGESIVIELRHGERCAVPKSEFEEHAARDGNASPPVDAKRALKQWLAARYGLTGIPKRLRGSVAKVRKREEHGRAADRENPSTRSEISGRPVLRLGRATGGGASGERSMHAVDICGVRRHRGRRAGA